MQCLLPKGFHWADSLLVTRELLEGQLIADHEIYVPRGVAKLANAKEAACVWKQWELRSAPEHRGLSACLGRRQTARVHHFCCIASSKSQLVIAKLWDLLLGEK